jgi:hypothetical protein
MSFRGLILTRSGFRNPGHLRRIWQSTRSTSLKRIKSPDLVLPHHSHPGHITSLQQVLSRPIGLETVIQTVWQTFCQVLKMNPLTKHLAVVDHQWSTKELSQPASKQGG